MTSVVSLIPGASGPGFVSIEARDFRTIVGEQSLTEWATFAESWNHLETDHYMADGGRFRRRRFASFLATPGSLTREAHGPHFQSRGYNSLNGGIDRWFEPVTDAIASHPVTARLLGLCVDVFSKARGEARSQAP